MEKEASSPQDYSQDTRLQQDTRTTSRKWTISSEQVTTCDTCHYVDANLCILLLVNSLLHQYLQQQVRIEFRIIFVM